MTEYPPDVVQANEKAFETAVKFYELDHDLTKRQRLKLADAYNNISYTSIAIGWSSFVGFGSIPFLLNRIEVNKTGGRPLVKVVKPTGRANLGIAIILGMVGMMISTPFGTSYGYQKELNKMKLEDAKCGELMDLLKPSESMKWWMYYKLTIEKPELIMKDPRTKEAYERRAEKQGKSAIYSNGKDVFGLYSGPGETLKKKNSELDLSEDHDPFEDKTKQESQYTSAWDRIRSESTNKPVSNNPDSAWNKVRSGSSTNSEPIKQEEDLTFQELIDRERYANDELENKKW